jgi:hypothetical protein
MKMGELRFWTIVRDGKDNRLKFKWKEEGHAWLCRPAVVSVLRCSKRHSQMFDLITQSRD